MKTINPDSIKGIENCLKSIEDAIEDKYTLSFDQLSKYTEAIRRDLQGIRPESCPQVRFILEHIYSNMDINGNRYWICRVTSTKTSKALLFSTPHSSNARASVKQDDIEWHEIYETREMGLPIREFNRLEKSVEMRDSCQDPEVSEAIRNLEKNA